MPGKPPQPEGEGRVTTGEVRPRGHLCGQSGAQALPLEDGSPFPCLSLCRRLREHTQGAPRARGGGGRRVTATVPLIQGFSRGPPAFPGLPSPRTVPSRRLCRLSVVPWETDSTASCFTLPRNPPALLLVLSETYPSVALAALHRFWT